MDATDFDYATADIECGGAISLHLGARAYDAAMHESRSEERERLFRLAAHWYERSAEIGNAQAATNLGYVYLYGRIGNINEALAFTWFSRGAELGNEESCYKLGDLYKSGRGCDQDMNKAVELYGKAEQIARRTCNSDDPQDAAVLASIDLRLAEWYEQSTAAEMDSESVCDLYMEATALFEVALNGGLDWYANALEKARSGWGRTSPKEEDVIEGRRDGKRSQDEHVPDIRPLLALTDAVGILQGISQDSKPEMYSYMVGAVLDAFYNDWEGGDHEYSETLGRAGIRSPYQYLRNGDLDALNTKTVMALLTFIIRADHWNEGALAVSIEDGELTKVLRHMRQKHYARRIAG
ncbi:DUF6508 domain-containing protein [Bifidobacterium olomucense]|uniref:ADP-ribosylglycohydrolase n=1 Tax=Bifidobacterium olomucense TaxID=2675324 RepID=A0A7Y0HW31_9BIFI|nr:DUF6508 domain-containing protein [Bifidobacterium sp. DSM 109959]NMM97891.1 ADP-ribosylglycohydrolase [Bifidobacterium sp. DSM 109959]